MERWISGSDVAQKIEVLRGNAAEILPTFTAASADAVFIDADKESCLSCLREGMRIVRRGGLVPADNTFGFGRLIDAFDRGASAMRSFNDIMAKETGLRSVIVPIGEGLWFGLKT